MELKPLPPYTADFLNSLDSSGDAVDGTLRQLITKDLPWVARPLDLSAFKQAPPKPDPEPTDKLFAYRLSKFSGVIPADYQEVIKRLMKKKNEVVKRKVIKVEKGPLRMPRDFDAHFPDHSVSACL